MSIAAYILIGILFLLGLTLLVGSFALYFFNTDAVVRRQLKRQAKDDYRQARGTAHKQLLETAAREINRDLKGWKKQNEIAEAEKRRLIKSQNAELDRLLVRWLVKNRLQEVNGIGEVRKQQIISQVFRGRLSDLHQAHQVDGIGSQTQWHIDEWVRRYQTQLPRLRDQDFHGKQLIVSRYKPLIDKQEDIKRRLKAETTRLEKRLQPINQQLKWLTAVKDKTFILAYKQPEKDWSNIDRYLEGIFPEWGLAPDWFRAEMTTKKE